MKNIIRIVGLFTIAIAFFCNSVFAQNQKVYANFNEMFTDVKKSVKMISLEDMKKKVDSKDSSLLIIDVREQTEFSNGRIPMAICSPKSTIEKSLAENVKRLKKYDLKKNDAIILYCKNEERSVLCAESLARLGYTNVSVIAEGLDGWIKAKYELDKSRYRPGMKEEINNPNQKSKEEIQKMRDDIMKKKVIEKKNQREKN